MSCCLQMLEHCISGCKVLSALFAAPLALIIVIIITPSLSLLLSSPRLFERTALCLLLLLCNQARPFLFDFAEIRRQLASLRSSPSQAAAALRTAVEQLERADEASRKSKPSCKTRNSLK